MKPLTLYEKIWNAHVVGEFDGQSLLYIDRHFVHEVTSPQPFESLRANGRKVWRAASMQAVADHNVPTLEREKGIVDPVARVQVEALEKNCQQFGVSLFAMDDVRQGIVHVVGPEQGLTLPGMTIVCGDSHTSTHGALAALAFGIGTSEVEHVMATQTLMQHKTKTMRITVEGELAEGVCGKDVMLFIIGKIGADGGIGYTLEFAGSTIEALSMEERMSVCNMSIEAGARAGLIAVDKKTLDYVQGRKFAPKGEMWEKALAYWQTLKSDEGAVFDREVKIDAKEILPQVSWGTSPEMVCNIDGRIPHLEEYAREGARETVKKALQYMGLSSGQRIRDIAIDAVFIGSCTNARIEDLRAAATILKGKKIAQRIEMALVVPGSGLVKQQAELEGLDQIFIEAGFEWREPGCSMCLAMNADRLPAGKRCASTSNRNFEGRQGQGGRTHLVSPAMAAAAAVAGHFVHFSEV